MVSFKGGGLKLWAVCAAVALFVVGCGKGGVEYKAPDGYSDVLLAPLELTGGARIRVVWVRDMGDGSDWLATGDNLVLMGYDSADGEGERILHQGFGNYTKPLISPDGSKILVSLADGSRMRLIDWESGAVEELGEGHGLAFNKEGREVFVYYGIGKKGYRGTLEEVQRLPLRNPNKRELVFKHQVAADSFTVDRSGKFAAGLFPWPKANIVDLETKELKRFGRGCWVSLAPDGSGMHWVFEGTHLNVNLFKPGQEEAIVSSISRIPGIVEKPVYYPRWTNHERFIVVGAPFQPRANAESNIYLGRFDADYSGVEAWARISYDPQGDFFPDAWIDTQNVPVTSLKAGPTFADRGETGSTFEPVPLKGRLKAITETPDPQTIIPYNEAIAVYLYEVEAHPDTGEPGEIMVGHWVIRDGRKVRNFSPSIGELVEMKVVPYSGNPKYEGDRVLIDVSGGGGKVFIDESR
ncbi:MAG: hypothetical protein ACFCU4_04440 [Puniceicoccaceae bacterium]